MTATRKARGFPSVPVVGETAPVAPVIYVEPVPGRPGAVIAAVDCPFGDRPHLHWEAVQEGAQDDRAHVAACFLGRYRVGKLPQSAVLPAYTAEAVA